jgi:hypothetical protein
MVFSVSMVEKSVTRSERLGRAAPKYKLQDLPRRGSIPELDSEQVLGRELDAA